MKTHLFYSILLASVAFATSCGTQETPYDYYETEVTIYVRNAEGVNLLSPREAGSANHILFDPISIDYAGRNYPVPATNLPGDPRNPTATRANEVTLPRWDENGRTPLKWNDKFDDSSALIFGEFSVDTKSYKDEEFTINWGDGSKTEVKFDLYPVWEEGKDQPTVREATWIKDGEGEWKVNSTTSLIVNIVK
jgi:hypothetical protein